MVCGTKKANIFLKADFLSRVETDSFTSNDFPILQLYEANVIMFFVISNIILDLPKYLFNVTKT
jgi:hypothetical protein